MEMGEKWRFIYSCSYKKKQPLKDSGSKTDRGRGMKTCIHTGNS